MLKDCLQLKKNLLQNYAKSTSVIFSAYKKPTVDQQTLALVWKV